MQDLSFRNPLSPIRKEPQQQDIGTGRQQSPRGIPPIPRKQGLLSNPHVIEYVHRPVAGRMKK